LASIERLFDGNGVIELDDLGETVSGNPNYERVVRLNIWAVRPFTVARGQDDCAVVLDDELRDSENRWCGERLQ
jgi:hypothetical protein